jgi:glycosyltransferase involved in cell wall biosynthesis
LQISDFSVNQRPTKKPGLALQGIPVKKVHILFEYGPDFRPHGSAYIRLLRPLSHPAVQAEFDVTSGHVYDGQQVDVVIVDRLWRPDVSLSIIHDLIRRVRLSNARLVYALDDNFLDMQRQVGRLSHQARVEIVETILCEADQVWVTTQPLKERYSPYNSNLLVIPNALDERLVVPRSPRRSDALFGRKRVTIGCMGTFTHDDDLLMVKPALEEITRRYPRQVEFQLIGVVRNRETLVQMDALPLNIIQPEPDEIEYPLFMMWFTGQVNWDIAISPLMDDEFNRCKSDIKFLDYCSIAAAGIFSQVPAYQDTLRPLETGLLVQNQEQCWVEALDRMIREEDLRAEISRAATLYLYHERTVSRCVGNWIDALNRL